MALAKPRLRIVFFLAFSITAIVPVLMLGWWVIDSARSNEYMAVKEKHLLVAKNITLALSRYSHDVKSVLELAASTTFDANNKPLNDLLYSQNITSIRVFDKKAYQKHSLNTENGTEVLLLTAAQLDAVNNVSKTQKTIFLPVQLSGNNKPCILVVTPLLVGDGYLVAELKPKYISQLQNKIKFGKLGHAAIVDQLGNIIAHPNQNWVSQVKNISKISIVQRMMNKETGVDLFYSPAKKANMIAGFSIVDETGWGVMIPQPIAELEEHISIIKMVAINISLLGIAFSMLLSWFLAGKLTQPTRQIALMAQKLITSEHIIESSVIPTYTKEQHELSDAFSRMTHSLNRKNKELLYAARHDALTGLANRHLLRSYLSERIEKQEKFYLILLDLNDFKDINDHWSHAHGDELLKAVAERLVNVVDEQGLVSRIGGDEFAIVFYTLASQKEVEDCVGLLIAECHLKYPILKEILRIKCSFGLACYPKDADNMPDLMQCADLAMYAAKRQLDTNYLWYTDKMRVMLNERIELTQALREAIKQQQFIVHYQPKVHSHSFQIKGLEALVRWEHPQKGLVYPEVFIPLAEKTGLIGSLGKLIFDLVCQDLANWKQQSMPTSTVSVNLSTRQFDDEQLATNFKKMMGKYSLSAKEIEFEITESVFVKNTKKTNTILTQLGVLGCDISVDDFGTGESSLARLKDFNVDIIKLDKSFVDDITVNEKALAIMTSILNMAQVLGLRVVIEGVETTLQLEAIQKVSSAAVIQGFIFSRGVEASRVVKLINEGVIAPTK